MLVDNIFSLVNGKQEDQLSAGFGFVLKNNKKILKDFLQNLDIGLSEKELKSVDIETQTTYDSGESRIDLHLLVPNKFLIFLESKIVTAPKIDSQLLKYAKILKSKRDQYESVKLVYVNKFPLKVDDLEKLQKLLGLRSSEFYFFSWEDLLAFTKSGNKEIIKLFSNYIGDTMFSKKIIAEQKIKNVVDVMVVFTKPEFMEFTRRTGFAVQINGAPDAHYIALLETHRPNGKRSAITHIAEVEYSENNVPRSYMLKGLPKTLKEKLSTHMLDRGYELSGFHKQYKLKLPLVKLAREIPHITKGGPIVKFRTTMAELLKAETTQDIRKGKFE